MSVPTSDLLDFERQCVVTIYKTVLPVKTGICTYQQKPRQENPLSFYDEETAVKKISDNQYLGYVTSHWGIGDNPNGGYLVSIALAALADSLPHPDPITVTTHYLRPGIPDAECSVRVEIIRTGRTLSTARASLYQDDKARIEVLAAFGDLTQSVGVDTEIRIPAPVVSPPEDCVQRSGARQGIHLPILGRVDIRLLPESTKQVKRAELSGWNRFVDDREPDTRSLLLFVDTFPPSPFPLLGEIGWVPTLELTVHIRRRPAPGWIQTHVKTEDLYLGRMIENGKLWDSEGNLVAQSRQIGLVMKQD